MARHREFDPDEALEAALCVFWQKGYSLASLDDLTRATGVARPSLYLAFGNKESLFGRAQERYSERYFGFVLATLEEKSARAAIAQILHGVAGLCTSSPDHPGCLWANAIMSCDANSASVELVLNRRDCLEGAVRARLERACSEWELKDGTDCGGLTSYFTTTIHSLAVQAKGGPPRSVLDTVVRRALAAWPGPTGGETSTRR